jgi:hexosaminidase
MRGNPADLPLPPLLPRPQTVVPLPGVAFHWPDVIRLPVLPAGCDRLAWDLGQLADRLLACLGVRVLPAVADAACPLALNLKAAGPAGRMSAEGYTLQVGDKGVRITAVAEAGLAMGLRTLTGLVQGGVGRQLQGVKITDAPDLPLRAAHLDLMLTRPSLAGWEQQIDRLASHKYNAVLLEYNGVFPFSPKLGIAMADAFSKRELRRMLAMLAERGIEAIPLQQCFGHFEYVLRQPRYASLREDGRFLGQPCPLIPESARLVRRLLDEVADMHEGAPRFHLGGDEVLMGKCPQCAAKAAVCGCAGIYRDFVEPLVDHVAARGFKPMLWADLFLRYYEMVPAMVGKVTLVDWNYGATADSQAATFWRLHRQLTPEAFHLNYPDPTHPEHQKAFKHYFPKPGAMPDPLYTSRFLQDHGYDVAGASAVSVGGSQWLPDLALNLANGSCHARHATVLKMAGTIVTRWGACLPAWEAAEPGFAAGAATAWNSAHPLAELEADLGACLWGLGPSRTLAAWSALAALRIPCSRLAACDWPNYAEPAPRDVRRELRALLRDERPGDLAQRLEQAAEAAAVLVREARLDAARAKRNRGVLEYLALAAEVAGLRCAETLFILRGLAGEPGSTAEQTAMAQAEARLQKRTAAILRRRMTQDAVNHIITMLFAGERRLLDFAAPDRAVELLSH